MQSTIYYLHLHELVEKIKIQEKNITEIKILSFIHLEFRMKKIRLVKLLKNDQ